MSAGKPRHEFAYRGVMYDVSRGRIPKRQTIEEQLRRLKDHGLNVVMLYIESVVQTRIFAPAFCGRTPLTEDYIRRLDDFCRGHDIRLVPILQGFGHQEHLLALPAFRHLAEIDSPAVVGSNNFTPTVPEVYERLEAWITEIHGWCDSPWLNVGCDELFRLGRGRTRAWVERKGLARVFADHILRLHGMARRLGKPLMMWADMLVQHPEVADMLPKDIVMVNWGYEPRTSVFEEEDHSFARHRWLARKGFPTWAAGNTGLTVAGQHWGGDEEGIGLQNLHDTVVTDNRVVGGAKGCGVALWVNPASSSGNCTFADNRFEGLLASGIVHGSGFSTPIGGNRIVYNLILDCCQTNGPSHSGNLWGAIRLNTSQTSPTLVANNTIIGGDVGVLLYSGPNHYTIANNISFLPSVGHVRSVSALAQNTFDHNGYEPDAADAFQVNGVDYGFAAWLTLTGLDSHSWVADPRFTAAAQGDYTLQSSSPFIDAGTDFGLTRDIAGHGVPTGLAPDLGAFEHRPPAEGSWRTLLLVR